MITSIHRKILDEVQNALSFQLRENTWSLRFLYYKFPVFWEENLKSTSIESSLGVNLRFLSRTTRQKQAIANLCCKCHCGQKLTEDPKFVVIKMTSYSLKFFSKIWTKLDKTDVNFIGLISAICRAMIKSILRAILHLLEGTWLHT
jgi:hypothetical protein